jgi:hypothetical protein
MLHKFFEEGDWFAAKEAGYGAGLPTAWQGWVLLLAYLGVVLGIGLLLTGGDVIDIVIGIGAIMLVTIPFLMIVKRRTKGGWKWRP